MVCGLLTEPILNQKCFWQQAFFPSASKRGLYPFGPAKIRNGNKRDDDAHKDFHPRARIDIRRDQGNLIRHEKIYDHHREARKHREDGVTREMSVTHPKQSQKRPGGEQEGNLDCKLSDNQGVPTLIEDSGVPTGQARPRISGKQAYESRDNGNAETYDTEDQETWNNKEPAVRSPLSLVMVSGGWHRVPEGLRLTMKLQRDSSPRIIWACPGQWQDSSDAAP